MSVLQHELPAENSSARHAIYNGQLYLLRATDVTRRLVDAVWNELEKELGQDGAVRQAQFRFDDDQFFQRIGRLRHQFYTAREYHEMVADVIHEFGFHAGDHAFDPIRLRVISHEGHNNPSARPMYYGHRDTWYSNPQAMITWWVPLHEVMPEETFEFFPEDFSRPVHNDSEVFDFDEWVADGQQRRIGWQDKATGRTARYPQLLEQPQGQRVPVTCQAGDLLLFSAQQLHKTRLNMTGKTRFSLDFRSVHLGDHADQVGPTNIDNRSTGCSLRQFVHP